jgi:error-prone DNA polymerase
MSYVELHARSVFSFLRGASHPEQLAEVAAQLNLPAMAVCDRDGFYGSPRFFKAANEKNVQPIVGAELTMEDGSVLPLLVENRSGYQNLCRLLTRAHLRSEKGKSKVGWAELPEFAGGLVVLTGDENGPLVKAICSSRREEALTNSVFHVARSEFEVSRLTSAATSLERLVQTFGRKNVFVEIQRHHIRGEERINKSLVELAENFRLPLLATNGVLYADPAGRQVMDVFTCVQNHTHLDAAGKLLAQNSERFLKGDKQMRELFRDLPEAIENTSRLAERLEFRLNNLGYEFPKFQTPNGEPMENFLRQVTFDAARKRIGHEIPGNVKAQLEKELHLINKLGFAGYFLIVWDIVNFCRDQKIMCQGRGSAANSAVCYYLGITAVDAVKSELLFERFLTEGQTSWPDIDIDLPSGERREKVIQEVYKRYNKNSGTGVSPVRSIKEIEILEMQTHGQDARATNYGAAMTANVISYRGRSAAREIGKALNISGDVLDRFSNLFANGDFPHTLDFVAQMEKAGLPKRHPRTLAFATLYQQIAKQSLPRHLGQHSGGMIICQGKLDSIVPLENASMPGRVVAQWDKDDCDELGIIKVDFLGLGMMSVLQDAIELTKQRGNPVDIANLPEDDSKTFEMIRAADTIGVFQIESRAQMATLPRMKPRCFYDIVIEVAIIRPGPIEGGLMHPFLERRAGRAPETYYHKNLEPVLKPILKRTLGVPLFQEQILAMAMKLVEFRGKEMQMLRKALSFHRSKKEMAVVEKKLRIALEERKYPQKVTEEILHAIKSFALYGFPESHAISFALLAYATAYLKAHRAPEFYASLLNNQPMGFYSSATIVKDGKRHGIKFRPVCAGKSQWLCTIEPDNSIRLGFCVVQGLREDRANKMLEERARQNFASIQDFKLRTRWNKEELRTLAEIGALNGLAKHRREALWEVEKDLPEDDLFSFAARSNCNDHPHPGPLPEGEGELVSALEMKPTFSSDPMTKNRVPSPWGEGQGEGDKLNNCPLLPMNPAERLRADYAGTNLTTGQHPMALLRESCNALKIWRACDLPKARNGQWIRIAGNVICRQRPGTAKGFVFITLEDETGMSNAIVAPKLFEKLRLVITQESFLMIEGRLQNSEGVILIQAQRIQRLAHENLAGSSSYDFH